MSTSFIKSAKKTKKYKEWQCLLIFMLLLLPCFFIIVLFQQTSRFLFHSMLFITGWFTWTFFEYMTHRFWMHHKHAHINEGNFSSHMHHHQHPTDIKITGLQRTILLLAGIGLLILNYWWNNYFTLFTGLFFGFVLYCFMHVWLHQRWSQKILGDLHRYHIHHHCKHPDKCFGISVTWWDRIFKTTPPGEAIISQRIIDFYFDHKHV